MNAMRLFALLVYTFGVLAYGAILALWIGEMGRRGWGGRTRAVTPGREVDALNGVLLALSLLWFLCNVGSLVVSMTPRTNAWPVEAATVVLAFCFPPVIMHVSWAEVSHNCEQPLSRGWRIALWPAYAMCLSMPIWALMLLAAPISSRDAALANRVLGGGLSGAFIATAIYCMALLTRRRPTAGLRDRQSRRSILVLFACMIAVFVLLFVVSTSTTSVRPMATLGDLIEVIAKSLPLVFVFVGTYYENRFQFFDLFVKRGVGFVLSIVVLTIWLAAMLPVLRPVISTWAAPWIFAVLCFVSEDGITKVRTIDQHYWMSPTLNDLESRLDPREFFRISRAAIVHLDAVREVAPTAGGHGEVTLKDGSRHDVSRRRFKELTERLGG